jgi:polar amino acid transport system permease protein
MTATGSAAPERLVAVPVRHYGRWVSGAAVLAAVAAVVYAFSQAQIDYGTTGHFLTASNVVHGAARTLLISVLAQAMGIVLGVVFAVMRLSRNPVTSTVSWLYIWLFRGTPVLVQLLIWYNLALVFPTFFGRPMSDLMTPFLAALLGLGINEGAYMAEIVRAGIGSVDEGQTEAASALGMTSGQTLRRVVLPQAMRVIIPPTGNEFINMLKTSSLAYTIQYGELLLSAVSVYTRNLQVIELLFTVSIWYLLLTSVFSMGQYYVERRFSRGAARELPQTPLSRLLGNLRGRPRF